MADVWLAPYLPPIGETQVGPWRLIPFSELAQRHTRGRSVFNEVRRLRTAYRVPAAFGGSLGAVVAPTTGRIGDDLDRNLIQRLRRVLTATLIDGNPSLIEDDQRDGWHTATSENAWVLGHPLTGRSGYALEIGRRVRQSSYWAVEPSRRLPRIAPPPELPRPSFVPFDEEYATALWETLSSNNETARQLDRAIEWLGLAWVNSEPVSEDVRILALRAAFDVLFGGGAWTRTHRERLSQLLDPHDAPRQARSWRGGPKQAVELTALEWWFQSFANLRNAIAHGDALDNEDWLFEDGKRHLWHADDILLRAIKRTVARAGDFPELEASRLERAIRRSSHTG